MHRLVIVSLAIVALLAAATPASAARLRAYRGETSAGTRIGFVLRVSDDGRMWMKRLHLKVELPCEDASMIEYDSFWVWGGVGHRLDGRSLTFDNVFWSEALHIAGVFRGQTADGTYKNTQAALTEAEEAQLCTTGDLTWTAERVALDRASGIGSPRGADVVHHVSGDETRKVATVLHRPA